MPLQVARGPQEYVCFTKRLPRLPHQGMPGGIAQGPDSISNKLHSVAGFYHRRGHIHKRCRLSVCLKLREFLLIEKKFLLTRSGSSSCCEKKHAHVANSGRAPAPAVSPPSYSSLSNNRQRSTRSDPRAGTSSNRVRTPLASARGGRSSQMKTEPDWMNCLSSGPSRLETM